MLLAANNRATMHEYYYGGIGKDKSWGLLSSRRIVVWRKTTGESTAFESISEADKQFSSASDNIVYFWDGGEWKQVDFLFGGSTAKVIKGFSPEVRPKD